MHRISTGLNICTKSNCHRNSSVTMCKTSTDDTLHLISFDLQTIKCVKTTIGGFTGEKTTAACSLSLVVAAQRSKQSQETDASNRKLSFLNFCS